MLKSRHILHALGALLALLIVWTSSADVEQEDMHNRVLMRMIGDAFLRQAGDSLTPLLPVVKIAKGQYVLQFEQEIAFAPEMLTAAVSSVLLDNYFDRGMIVEARQCATEEVVYSFEIHRQKEESMIPCKGRALPVDCYKVYVTLLQDQQQTGLPTAAEAPLTTGTVVYAIVGGVVLLFLGWLLYRRKKNKTVAVHPDWVAMGDYWFDKKAMKLIYNNREEELSSKEADLLEILYTHRNETVSREHILHVGWGDEGDYIGRTLDVFISKLRKKLERDPAIKIVNIRGVGYRLVLQESA